MTNEIRGFADDGHGRFFTVWLGAYGSQYVVRCSEDSVLEAAYDASGGGYFEVMEYPEQGEDETDEAYYRRCDDAEVDLSIVYADCEARYIPSWEWGYREATEDEVREWKVWFADQYL